MKILIISQYFFPENFRVNHLAKELKERGNEVTVLTGYPQYPYGKIYQGYGFRIPYEKQWNGVTIERVKMTPRGKTPFGLLQNCISFVREGNKWVKKCKEKYDAIYVFEVSPVTVGLPAVSYYQKFGTPVFFNVQDLWPENVEHILGIKNKLVLGFIDKIVDKIYNNSFRILCSSTSFVEHIAKRGVEKKKLVYWPQFCDKPNPSKMNKPEVYSEDTFNIVYAGNLGKAQGLDLLIESISQLKQDNIKCFFIGDGRMRTELEEKVHALNLEDKVFFIGAVSVEKANEYVYFADSAYISLVDNFIMDMTIPAKLQTYLACGTPIIGAVSGECEEIIQGAECGIVVDKNINALTDGIQRMTEMSYDQKELLRKNANLYFDKNFDKDKLIGELEQMMRESR